jgi:hypothetical protein
MMASSRTADDTPIGVPFLDHWRGSYDRAFVILHPLEAKDGSEVGHAETAAAIGAPLFEEFEIALMLAAYGMSADRRRADLRPRVNDELISKISQFVEWRGLDYPADDHVAPSIQRAAAVILRTLGVDHAEIWSNHRTDHTTVSLVELANGAAGHPVAIADPHRRVFFDCDFAKMDTLWCIVAWQAQVDDVACPAQRFEGFEVDMRTTPDWPNCPGTYQTPQGWPV